MREIKFRAWHPKTKEMAPVETIDWDETQYLTEVSAGYTWGEKFNAASFQQLVLMQYTGLKDKNGKEIYESDIIVGSVGTPAAVVWHLIGWWAKEADESLHELFPTDDGSFVVTEVIGNIYRNPELLK